MDDAQVTTVSRNAVEIAKSLLQSTGDAYEALLVACDLYDRMYRVSSCGFIRDRQPEYGRNQPRAPLPPPNPVLTSGGQ